MTSAKLRRSRDVSVPDPIKIENLFRVSALDEQAGASRAGRKGDDHVHQASDVVAKSQLTGGPACRECSYVISGEHRTAQAIRGASPL